MFSISFQSCSEVLGKKKRSINFAWFAKCLLFTKVELARRCFNTKQSISLLTSYVYKMIEGRGLWTPHVYVCCTCILVDILNWIENRMLLLYFWLPTLLLFTMGVQTLWSHFEFQHLHFVFWYIFCDYNPASNS